MKNLILLVSALGVSCTTLRVKYRATIVHEGESKKTPFEVYHEESIDVSNYAAACWITGIFYGGACWTYLNMPFGLQRKQVAEHAERKILEKYGTGDVIYEQQTFEQVNWQWKSPRTSITVKESS